MTGSAARRVVVTGGSGFIGTRVRAGFARGGDEVLGLDLRAGRDAGGMVTGCDLATPGKWQRLLSGADVVVHTAARVGERGTVEEFRRANVEATQNVIEAATEAGVGCLIHLSSITVVGPDVPSTFDEGQPVHPTGNPYTDSKIVSEHLALAAGAGGLPVTVLRPGDVYGPGSFQWTIRPVALLRRGMLILPGGGGTLDPIYVDDLADAVVAAAEPGARHGLFLVTGGQPVAAREFFGFYGNAVGKPVRSVPKCVMRAAPSVEWALGKTGYEPAVTTRTVEYVTRTGGASIERARTQLGWSPKVDLIEGMSRTLDWLGLHT